MDIDHRPSPSTPSTVTAPAATSPTGGPIDDHQTTLLADELLVEEISIDGMCGVY